MARDINSLMAGIKCMSQETLAQSMSFDWKTAVLVLLCLQASRQGSSSSRSHPLQSPLAVVSPQIHPAAWVM